MAYRVVHEDVELSVGRDHCATADWTAAASVASAAQDQRLAAGTGGRHTLAAGPPPAVVTCQRWARHRAGRHTLAVGPPLAGSHATVVGRLERSADLARRVPPSPPAQSAELTAGVAMVTAHRGQYIMTTATRWERMCGTGLPSGVVHYRIGPADRSAAGAVPPGHRAICARRRAAVKGQHRGCT